VDGYAVEAVVFDWGGTLTPWHSIDLREQWLRYAEVYDPDRADELSARILAAEDEAWQAGREHHRSATLDQIFAGVGVDVTSPLHGDALAAYHRWWEPHTHTDPDVPVVLTGLRERGIRVGVLSNTLWTRDYHESVFRRDGVLDLIDGAVYSSERSSSVTGPSTTSTGRSRSACVPCWCRTARSRTRRRATSRATRTPSSSGSATCSPWSTAGTTERPDG
jgi:phosphoglycolate phosphatase-like HAD superfamily hydrolase